MTVADVYHNVAVDLDGRPLGMLDGYQPEHPLTLVARLKVPGSVFKDEADEYPALEEVFRLLNVGDDPDYGTPDPQAQEYRFRGNRSLSVGDVVKLQGGRWFAVARLGWDTIPEPTVFASQLGSRDEHRALMAQAKPPTQSHRGGPKMRNPFKRDPEKVAAAKLKDEARRARLTEATRIRDEKFAAANARYAASKAVVTEQRRLNTEAFRATVAANTELYRDTTAAIDGDDLVDPPGAYAREDGRAATTYAEAGIDEPDTKESHAR